MPRSSRHKSSHKQSKHSSKEAKEYYSDSDEDVVVRMKDKERSSGKEDGGVGGSGSVRVSKDSGYSASGEKRKLSSSSLLREGKDGKDLNVNGNGDALEEYVSSKRRKEKAEGGGGGDRWTAGGDGKDDGGAPERELRGESLKIDSERSNKSKESKGYGDSKSKSSKRQDSGLEKEEKTVGLVEKEDSRSGSGRGESKRKSDKDSGRKEGKESREVKEKDRGSEREKKGQESKSRDYEVRSVDTQLVKKQGSQWEDGGEERQSKKGREINGKVTLFVVYVMDAVNLYMPSSM